MLIAPVTRVLAASAAVLIVAGCAGSSTPSVSPPQSQRAALSERNVPMRTLPGPAVSGNIRVPAIAPKNGPGYFVQGIITQLVYVADIQHSQVLIYKAAVANPSPSGMITTGVSNPAGLAIDSTGKLYVSNLGNNTITEYPHGQTSPSFTISTGLAGNYGVAVDFKGNVFATNLNNNTVVGYHKGSSTPFETINISGQPVGIAADSNNNIYIASDTTSQIWFLKAGSKTPAPLALSGLNGPIGVTIGDENRLYVANFGSNQDSVYLHGKTTPAYTITTGISQPTLNGITASQLFFQSDQTGTVVGYKGTAKTPFSTITGIPQPLGIAGYPRITF